jgi:hypothetical protein
MSGDMHRSSHQGVAFALLGSLVAVGLAACGGGSSDASTDVEVAMQSQYSDRQVACARSDHEYGGSRAYSCTVGKKRICVAYVDGETLELWDERPLRPGERGYDPNIAATVRDGPSC